MNELEHNLIEKPSDNYYMKLFYHVEAEEKDENFVKLKVWGFDCQDSARILAHILFKNTSAGFCNEVEAELKRMHKAVKKRKLTGVNRIIK
jgi:hypothetical protein